MPIISVVHGLGSVICKALIHLLSSCLTLLHVLDWTGTERSPHSGQGWSPALRAPQALIYSTAATGWHYGWNRHEKWALIRTKHTLVLFCAPSTDMWQMNNQILRGLSDVLGIVPPMNGSVDPYPTASDSPMPPSKRTSVSSTSSLLTESSPLGSPVAT